MASRLSHSPARSATRDRRNACFASPAEVAHDPHEHEESIRYRDVMLNRYTLTALGVLIVLAVLFILHTDDEDIILQRLEQLRALTEITYPETGIEPLV